MGFRANAAINATTQALQEAEAQRRRAEQLERRNRRLRSAASMSWALFVTVAVTAAAIGLVIGYSVGVGLLGAMGR
jgi:hypothetical protein